MTEELKEHIENNNGDSSNDKHLQTIDNLNSNNEIEKKSNWGGFRDGAGRRLGVRNISTLKKEEVRRAVEKRILAHADRLANAQLKLALGNTFLFRIDTVIDGKGNKQKQRPVVVDNIEEIIDYLDWLDCDGEPVNNDTTYYFITTKDSDGRAIDSLLDRTFGRPVQGITI
jgi:hypothetical protein